MANVSDFLKSFAGSLNFVLKHKLYFYFLPSILLAILFYMSFKSGQSISNKLEFMESWWVIGSIVKGMESGIKLIAFLTFEIVILVFLTPINSYFAEKVKEDVTGIKVEFDFKQLVRSIFSKHTDICNCLFNRDYFANRYLDSFLFIRGHVL